MISTPGMTLITAPKSTGINSMMTPPAATALERRPAAATGEWREPKDSNRPLNRTRREFENPVWVVSDGGPCGPALERKTTSAGEVVVSISSKKEVFENSTHGAPNGGRPK